MPSSMTRWPCGIALAAWRATAAVGQRASSMTYPGAATRSPMRPLKAEVALAVEIAFEAVADRLVQQHAGPARAEHHTHTPAGAGRIRDCHRLAHRIARELFHARRYRTHSRSARPRLAVHCSRRPSSSAMTVIDNAPKGARRRRARIGAGHQHHVVLARNRPITFFTRGSPRARISRASRGSSPGRRRRTAPPRIAARRARPGAHDRTPEAWCPPSCRDRARDLRRGEKRIGWMSSA